MIKPRKTLTELERIARTALRNGGANIEQIAIAPAAAQTSAANWTLLHIDSERAFDPTFRELIRADTGSLQSGVVSEGGSHRLCVSQLRHLPAVEEACMFGIWMKLALDTSMLALETQQVIGLRLMKLTFGGPAAAREANRMVAEKVIAFGEAAAKVATGSATQSVVKGYRKKVRANRRRLTK